MRGFYFKQKSEEDPTYVLQLYFTLSTTLFLLKMSNTGLICHRSFSIFSFVDKSFTFADKTMILLCCWKEFWNIDTYFAWLSYMYFQMHKNRTFSPEFHTNLWPVVLSSTESLLQWDNNKLNATQITISDYHLK